MADFVSYLITEDRTVTAQDVVVGYMTLSKIPAAPMLVVLWVQGGTSQVYGTDYTVLGNKLVWLSLDLDMFLSEGDVLRISYPVADERLVIFNTAPSNDGKIYPSLVNDWIITNFLTQDPYFTDITKISRADVTFMHEDQRQKKTIIYMGQDFYGLVSWTVSAKPGIWFVDSLRLRDTDGALLLLGRDKMLPQFAITI